MPPQPRRPIDPDSSPPRLPRSIQPRFSLGLMLLVMLIISVAASGGYYMVRSLRGGTESRLVFVLFTLAAPVLLVVVISVLYRFIRRFRL